jgi:LssY C-terminus
VCAGIFLFDKRKDNPEHALDGERAIAFQLLMRLETGINPQDGTRPRRRRVWPFWIALSLLLIWAGAAYLLAPWLWKLYSRHHPSLDNIERITRTADGHPGDPLNIAIVATEEELIRAMVAIGWFPANSITFKSSLRIVVDSVFQRPDDEAPVSSLYLFGRKQDLGFEQPVGNSPRQRHHVRFWRSAQSEDDRPLWFGAATFDRSVGFSHTTGEVTHHIGPDVDAERDRIAQQLERKEWVEEDSWEDHFHKELEGRNGGGDPWHTDGKLVVVVLKDPQSGSQTNKEEL